MGGQISNISLENLKEIRDLKGDKDISEFTTLKEAVSYGYNENDWACFRIKMLGIRLLNLRLGSRALTKKDLGVCEKIGMSIYVNHGRRKVYSFSHYANKKFYYKEFYRYAWE